jgi:CheY-like chemotaxis protein
MDEQHNPSRPSRRPLSFNQKKYHILVVDDEEYFAYMVRDILNEYGYKTSVATTGQACLQFCREQIPDLILLDIRMPGMDGFQVCESLKNDPDTANIPIILLTGLAQSENKIRGFSLGVFHYITKPFIIEELLARIENILGRQNYLKKTVQDSKLDTLRQLAVTLADRINNPLAGIMACCQLLSRNIDDREKVIEIVETIKESVDQVYAVLVKLTTAERFESSEYTQGINMVDLDHLYSDEESENKSENKTEN